MIAVLVLWGCAPRPPQRLTLALEDDIVSLDPHAYDDEVTSSVLFNIYQGLVGFDPKMRIVPLLAERWENPNDLTWRFFLRPGIKFHDGRVLQAEDVAFSLKRARNGRLGHYLSAIGQIKALDPQTLEIVTKEPSPILLNKLSFVAIVPRGTGDTIIRPVGTGPYVLSDYRPGEHIILKSFNDYWGKRPEILEAEYLTIPEPEKRLEALSLGRIDLAKFIYLKDSVKYRGSPIQFVSLPGLGVTLLGLNLSRPGPLQDRRVRQAIFWSLDPQEIIAKTNLEATVSDQLVSPFVVGYLDRKPAGRPNLKMARKLLAGHRGKIAIDLEVATTVKTRAEVVAAQLARAGIEIRVVPREWPELNRRLEGRQCAFYLIGWACVTGDASDLLEACLHSPKDGRYGSANWSGYGHPEVDRLVELAASSLDNKTRMIYMQQALERSLEDLPLVPLYVRSQTYAYRQGLNFHPRQDGSVMVAEISFQR